MDIIQENYIKANKMYKFYKEEDNKIEKEIEEEFIKLNLNIEKVGNKNIDSKIETEKYLLMYLEKAKKIKANIEIDEPLDLKAREILKIAEENLLEYGIQNSPLEIRDAMLEMKKVYKIREKMLELISITNFSDKKK